MIENSGILYPFYGGFIYSKLIPFSLPLVPVLAVTGMAGIFLGSLKGATSGPLASCLQRLESIQKFYLQACLGLSS